MTTAPAARARRISDRLSGQYGALTGGLFRNAGRRRCGERIGHWAGGDGISFDKAQGDVLKGGCFEIPDNAGAALTATRAEVMG